MMINVSKFCGRHRNIMIGIIGAVMHTNNIGFITNLKYLCISSFIMGNTIFKRVYCVHISMQICVTKTLSGGVLKYFNKT